MKNIRINKTLTNIILIKGAFLLDRHKKKRKCILFPKTKTKNKGKIKIKKKKKHESTL